MSGDNKATKKERIKGVEKHWRRPWVVMTMQQKEKKKEKKKKRSRKTLAQTLGDETGVLMNDKDVISPACNSSNHDTMRNCTSKNRTDPEKREKKEEVK